MFPGFVFRARMYSKIGRLLHRFSGFLPLVDRPELELISMSNPERSIVGHAGYSHCVEPRPQELGSADIALETLISPSVAVRFRDVRLIGKFGIPVTRRGQIVVAPFLLDWFFAKILPQTLVELGMLRAGWEYLLALFPVLDRAQGEEGEGVFFHLIPRVSTRVTSGQGAQYGHWMVESLAHLILVEGLIAKIGPSFRLLLNSDLDEFQLDSLKLMGFSNLPFSKIEGNGLRVRELFVPSVKSFHSKSSEIDPEVRTWVRKRLIGGAEPDELAQSLPKVVFISRQNMPDRRLANIEKIRDLVKGFGGQEFETSVLPMAEEVMTLIDTRVLIGVSGSALAKMLFMPHLRHLVLLQHPDKSAHVAIARLAGELGVDCTVLLCRWATPESKDRHRNLLAPEAELRRVLHRLLE